MTDESRPPPPIRTDHSNAFANNTMRVRLPAIIDEVASLNPDYPPDIKRRLRRLRRDLAEGAPIADAELLPATDIRDWATALSGQRECLGREPTWHIAEWFFAETYAYRCLIEAVRWHETGRDPFLPKKLAELHSDALWQLLERAYKPLDSPENELRRAVEYALWGNRIDLSYAPSSQRGAEISAEDLLVDDRDALTACLFPLRIGRDARSGAAPIYVVADNAGSELAMDLVLSECLLRHVTTTVVICLKAHPTFVQRCHASRCVDDARGDARAGREGRRLGETASGSLAIGSAALLAAPILEQQPISLGYAGRFGEETQRCPLGDH